MRHYKGFVYTPEPKTAWENLPMNEKAAMIKVAVSNGITNLQEIKDKYNEFAEGGDTNPAMTGMMKSKLAISANFGNPTARRMINYDTRSYTWPGEYEYDKGIGEPKRGNVYVGSYENLVTPQIQDTGRGLAFIDNVWSPENDQRSYMQSIKFDNEDDAKYFGEHYKEVAPMMSLYDSGGKIHIKPENRGKFTALKERTGHSATWFKEHGTPAQKKMATFALNSRHWKHGLGGNLFDGESQSTQQMQIGREYWQSQANQPTFMEGLTKFNRQQKLKKEQQSKALRQQIRSTGKGLFDEAVKSAQTEANDNLWIDTPLTYKKAKNPHLAHRAEGAKAHAAWEKEHPNLSAWGNLAGAVPFAVAAIPFGAGIAAGGDALAATTAGQAVTSGLAPLATAASTSVAGAPLYTWADVGLSSLFAGHGVQTAIDEGGISPTTTLELLPVTRVVKPAVETGYNAAKPAIDRTVTTLQNNYPALFDPYTSWDATLGYHGDNIFSRALGTIGRRYGYTPKAEVPEFHRRLTINRPSQLKLDEEGNMIISSGRTGEGHDGIVNFATSEPARGHSSHKSLSGIDDYIIDSKAIGSQDFKSIQPSDTFFETGQLAIDPKSMTLVSGNTEMLDYARSLGMRTLSSPRLRQLTASRMTKEDVINSRSEGIAKFLQNVGEIRYGKGQENAGQIGEEMQRLTSMRGTPTMQDYSYFEGLTGLNSGVRPAEMWNGTKEQGLELFGNWGKPRRTPTFNHVAYAPASNIEAIYREAKMGTRPWEDYYAALENMPSARQQLGLNTSYRAYPNIRYEIPSNDIIIESSTSANPNIPFDEAWLAASKGRHQMGNLVGSSDYAGRVKQAYQDNGISINQADFEILQAKQGIEDSNLKVIPNLKSENGEVLNGQYDPDTRQVLISQDRDNILDVVESSEHEHAHASEVEKLLELLKEKWKHIKPRKEAFTRSDGSIDTEWKDYISKIVEMRAPAMSVWSEMKELGFNRVGDYLHHLKKFGLEDKQWEALVNRYGLTNAKYMVETVFGLSPFVINGINNEEKDSTTM